MALKNVGDRIAVFHKAKLIVDRTAAEVGLANTKLRGRSPQVPAAISPHPSVDKKSRTSSGQQILLVITAFAPVNPITSRNRLTVSQVQSLWSMTLPNGKITF